MAGTITKAGTGYGAILAISSTPATLSVPAPAPASTPTKFVVGSPIATITLTADGTTGYTSATALPTTTNGSGSGATITIVASAGAITSGTLVGAGVGYKVGDKVYPTQSGADGTAYFLVATISAAVTGIQIMQLKTFTMPSQKWAFDDITNVSSPTVGVGTAKESLLTVLDLGEFSAEGIFLPSDPGLVAVQTAFATGLPNAFQVELGLLPGQSSTGNVYAFNAWISENPIPTNVDVTKAIGWKMSLKLATIMTVALGS